MSILFISDLHLDPGRPDVTQQAVDFINAHDNNLKQLYILGDLFNTWLGDDIVPDEFQPLINALARLSQSGTDCYLMVGNRDFMLGKDFANRCGCQLISDPTVIKLADQNVLLMHGDSLCVDDVSYQRYRRWTRNRFLQWCFLTLSASYRQGISDKIKQKSRQQKQFKSSMIMDVNHKEVDSVMADHHINYMIHGHTHRPAIHSLANNKYRIVLGDWDQQVSYLKFDGKQLQLIDHRVPAEQSTLALA